MHGYFVAGRCSGRGRLIFSVMGESRKCLPKQVIKVDIATGRLVGVIRNEPHGHSFGDL